ncbi:glycosyltransferase involved in cell wall biosynthesis [Pseudomonas protegens]|uniref:glycosyltransferase family 4 protein n=1 Tax=Pseudomonas TaxID=286 RepID=UPI000F61EAA1|nr:MULTISPECIES: glycosyltransferase family 4 protein [Pseudomonas]MBF0642470.1 glycosyltransferase family 4 protein [Pseudomonas protegens]MDS9876709.1 glycosyltransferase family 4 protein [Pseudomonas protegens]MDT9642433.1 glycosyltransferase [Pseudomonas sp. JV245A]NAN50378.1 glycosyltransferase [Pseudomonas protegens]NUE73519.1 glycosyltransferase [Pseudomonas protegens]
MKVLHFYKTSYPDTMGGVEQVINQIARGAKRLGVETDVLSLTSERLPRSFEVDGYTGHRARMDLQVASTGFSASAFFRFAKLAKEADIVHYHFPWPFMDLVHFATRVKKPTIVTYHSDIIRQKNLLKIYRPLKLKFLGDVQHIVATSPNYFETSDVLRRYSDKVSVIPIGLDKLSYPSVPPSLLEAWRERVGSKFFLFVGVIRYYKGLHILMEAGQGLNHPIVILGAGPIELELKAQAEALGLCNVHFLGQLPDEDKVALLTLCYGVVFPSHLRSEAFGISLLEGAMYGKPMISSEIGTGTTFINIHGETGMVVPPSDAGALRQAMNYLWDNPVHAANMGENAEKRYWEHFTAEQMVRSYVGLYSELIATFHSR